MMVSVLFLTLSIVLADFGYSSVQFATGMVLFSLGNVIVGLVLWVRCPNIIQTVKHSNLNSSRTGIVDLISK